MIKTILFDMDGVLIDARDWHFEALNRALMKFGYEIELDAHLSIYDGLPTRTKLKMLTEARGLPTGMHNLLNKLKQSYTKEITHQRCKPTFNHQYALSRLKNDDFNIGVCSNSIRDTIQTMMLLSGLEKYLDIIVSNEDVKYPKPNPEMYVAAIKHFGTLPSETLILEDNEHGIEAAKKSGAHVMVINSPDDVTYKNICDEIGRITHE